MKKYTIIQYDSSYFSLWNAFVGQAKNATFLFHRNFMEYHFERFEDFSLLVFDGKKLVAVLPANKGGTVIYSHQGLTYGGLVYGDQSNQASIISIFKTVLTYLHQNNFEKLVLKTLPSIYNKKPAEELLYALFL